MASRLSVLYEVEILIEDYISQGFTDKQILAALHRRGHNYSYGYVRNMAVQTRSELRERRRKRIDEHLDQELETLHYIRRQAFSAYDRSLEPTITTEEVREFGGDDPNLIVEAETNALRQLVGIPRRPDTITRKVKTVTTSGDPRFLEVARSTSADIRKLYGIEPADLKRLELVIKDERLDPEKLRALGREELTRILIEQSRPESEG